MELLFSIFRTFLLFKKRIFLGLFRNQKKYVKLIHEIFKNIFNKNE